MRCIALLTKFSSTKNVQTKFVAPQELQSTSDRVNDYHVRQFHRWRTKILDMICFLMFTDKISSSTSETRVWKPGINRRFLEDSTHRFTVSATREITIGHYENKNVIELKLSRNEVRASILLLIYCTASFTSLSHGISYIASLFLEWPIF